MGLLRLIFIRQPLFEQHKMKTKSPLKQSPLPNPGSSIDKKINELIDESAVGWIVVSGILFTITVLEWNRYLSPHPPSPLMYTFFFLLTTSFTVYRVITIRKTVKKLRQGRDGEIAVGQFLERCRTQGAQVFHDVPGTGFNLDHVVIDKSGIYIIETKTISKPEKGKAELVFDGKSISCNGLFATEAPIIQVKAGRSWLCDLLTESSGRKLSKQLFRSVVVYPGWFVIPTAAAKSSDVWVLNPKALPSFIGNSAEQLSSEDLNLYSFHLSKYIRSCSVKK